jgi:NAD(P)H-flavin reductase
MDNIYLPQLLRIVETRDETPDVRTLVLEPGNGAPLSEFKPGQFCEISVFGAGECTFCIASSPTRMPQIECSFKLMGKVTTALRDCETGSLVGFRGPYGNWFPLDDMKGKSIVFVGGGIGMAPVRSIIEYCLDHRDDFRDITILNGARTASDLVYKQESAAWAARADVTLVKTVDPGGKEPGWDGRVGLIPPVLEEMAPSPDNAMAIICGPPIMIKFTLISLDKLGFSREQIVTTLENRMKCGFGKCGRCNVGPYYVCKDGPVFTAAQLAALPPDL